MKNVGVGLVGYGVSGSIFHASLLMATEGMSLVGVLTSRVEEINSKFPDVAVYSNLDSMLENSAIDLIVIASPNETHYSFALKALTKNKHVVIEKPFVVDLNQAHVLIKEAKSRNLILSVYHNRREDSDFLTLKKILNENQVGKLVLLSSRFNRYRPIVGSKWKEQPLPGSGALYDIAPHLLDQMLVLFGMPRALYAEVDKQREDALVDDYFHIRLFYENFKVVLESSSLFSNSHPRFEACGTLGHLTISGRDSQEALLKSNLRPGDKHWQPTQEIIACCYDNDYHKTHVNPVQGSYQDYYHNVRNVIQGKELLKVTAEHALEVVHLLQVIKESAIRAQIQYVPDYAPEYEPEQDDCV